MKKRKVAQNKWLDKIKKRDPAKSPDNQPYHIRFTPWAIKNYKKFFCKHKSPSFKTQGGIRFFLLERAREAMKNGDYERYWLNDIQN